jgi:hypothetical protein
MAKALVMAGREAGFDMDSKDGLEVWMRTMQSKPSPSSARLPPFGVAARPVDRAPVRAKRDQRKAARNARKTNR